MGLYEDWPPRLDPLRAPARSEQRDLGGEIGVGPFYAVGAGVNTGIFDCYKDAQMQVSGIPNSLHKKYPNLMGARDYYREHSQSGGEPILYLRNRGWAPPEGYRQGQLLPRPPTKAEGYYPLGDEHVDYKVSEDKVTWSLDASPRSIWGDDRSVPRAGPFSTNAGTAVNEAAAKALEGHMSAEAGRRAAEDTGLGESPRAEVEPSSGGVGEPTRVQMVEGQVAKARVKRSEELAKALAIAELEEAAEEEIIRQARRDAEDEANVAERLRREKERAAEAAEDQRTDESRAALAVDRREPDRVREAMGGDWARGEDATFVEYVDGIDDAKCVPDALGGEDRPFRITDGAAWNRVLSSVAGAVRLGFHPAAIHALLEDDCFPRSRLREAVEEDYRRSNAFIAQLMGKITGSSPEKLGPA